MDFRGKLGYEADIDLAKGVYEYKFKINGQWVNDNQRQTNGNGNHQFELSSS